MMERHNFEPENHNIIMRLSGKGDIADAVGISQTVASHNMIMS